MIKRKLLGELKNHLSKKEVSFIIGPRQAGKTTLMLFLREYLEKKNEKTVFLNLDIESDKQFFTSQANLINKIRLEIGGKRGFVFIDEIQRKEDAGIFLKGIYDMTLPYKFIVSGSGSVELKEKIHESLAGRKRIFELSTLSFEEFVNFKTDYKYEDKLSDFFVIDKEKTNELSEEYLDFGGYPRVVLEDTIGEKKKIINEIYQSYLEKDISFLLKIRKTEDFSNLVKVLASQIGQLFNVSEVSRTLGISQKTVKDYLWYLQKTFIMQKVTPYFKNIRKEITKAPIFYFYDLGLRNFAIGLLGNVKSSQEKGLLFENFVFNILKERFQESPAGIHFWRTKDGAKVDFVIDFGRAQIPVEVKYRDLKVPEMTRSFRGFIERYQPPKAFIINLCFEHTLSIKQTEIHFLPAFKIKDAWRDTSHILDCF
jgi:predicted AAA+ superfamily ATPase